MPRALIESCIEAVRHAPSASNTQGWRFIITEGELKDRLVKGAMGGVVVPNRFALKAPVVVVLAMELSVVTHRLGARIKDIDYHLVDAGIAGEHFVLQAAELGLSTCWIGWFNRRAARRALGVPWHVRVVSLIAVGYPREENPPSAPQARPLRTMTRSTSTLSSTWPPWSRM